MSPITNVTDPKSIRAREIPTKSEAEAAGETCALDPMARRGSPEAEAATGNAIGGGNFMIWAIIEQRSRNALE